jgi:hypothetical protein
LGLSWSLCIAGSSAAGDAAPWLHLAAPKEGESLVSLPLVEVRGFVGTGTPPASNVVVLIDLSRSTLLPSGFDVDLDGEIGEPKKKSRGSRYSTNHYSTDPDDTIARANLLAAEMLIRDLARSEVRVGLVAFARRARIYADLGPAPYALDALLRLEVDVQSNNAQTDLARGLRKALQVLAGASLESYRDSRIVIFSDGDPTYPNPLRARRGARRAAQDAAESGVQIHALQLGAEGDLGVLSELAQRTGGRFVSAQQRHDYAELLPIEAALRDVLLVNLTADTPGRLVRVFPDGSFDGYLDLVRGRNEIQVSATLNDGETVSALRALHFDPRAARDVVEMERIVELRNHLSDRPLETDLSTRPTQQPDEPTKDLEVRVEEEL